MGISKIVTVPVVKVVDVLMTAVGKFRGHTVSKMPISGEFQSSSVYVAKSGKNKTSAYDVAFEEAGKFIQEKSAEVGDSTQSNTSSRVPDRTINSTDTSRFTPNLKVNGHGPAAAGSPPPAPAEICKIIAADGKYAFRLDKHIRAKTQDNPEGLSGMDQLRHCLRELHGVDRKVGDLDNISTKKDGSPLDEMLKGRTIHMWRNKSETRMSTTKPANIDVLELDGRKVVQAQKDVQTWNNGLTDKEVKDILTFKSNHKVDVPAQFKNHKHSRPWEVYRNHLKGKAEKLVMRSTAFMTHTPTGELLDAPREHVVYHACYPELRNRTEAHRHFAPKGKLLEDRKLELRDRYKSIVLQQLKVASANGEDIDLQAPNAFLRGLDSSEQTKAKQLFRDAVYEAAREAKGNPAVYGGLKAIYIHDAAGNIPDDVRDMVFDNPGDAFSPDRVGQELGGRRVAVCIMSDGVGPVGNAALTDQAFQAMEENTARLCGGTLEATGPAFNPHCKTNVRDLAQARAAA